MKSKTFINWMLLFIVPICIVVGLGLYGCTAAQNQTAITDLDAAAKANTAAISATDAEFQAGVLSKSTAQSALQAESVAAQGITTANQILQSAATSQPAN